jgi:hypothetical protein
MEWNVMEWNTMECNVMQYNVMQCVYTYVCIDHMKANYQVSCSTVGDATTCCICISIY